MECVIHVYVHVYSGSICISTKSVALGLIPSEYQHFFTFLIQFMCVIINIHVASHSRESILHNNFTFYSAIFKKKIEYNRVKILLENVFFLL